MWSARRVHGHSPRIALFWVLPNKDQKGFNRLIYTQNSLNHCGFSGLIHQTKANALFA